jgi:hypothetical protein
MDDLRRIQYVAEHYKQLQGLRLLPLGIPFLISAAWRTLMSTESPGLSRVAWMGLLVTAIAASIPIGRYYTRRFGDADTLPWRAAAVLFGSFATLLGLEWLQEAWPAPVSLPVLFVAIALARVGLVADCLRLHYVWIAVACIVFASLAPLGVPLEIRAVALDALIGGGLIVAAIGDDRVLRRAMVGRVLA